jgi:hypothetical protein
MRRRFTWQDWGFAALVLLFMVGLFWIGVR